MRREALCSYWFVIYSFISIYCDYISHSSKGECTLNRRTSKKKLFVFWATKSSLDGTEFSKYVTFKIHSGSQRTLSHWPDGLFFCYQGWNSWVGPDAASGAQVSIQMSPEPDDILDKNRLSGLYIPAVSNEMYCSQINLKNSCWCVYMYILYLSWFALIVSALLQADMILGIRNCILLLFGSAFGGNGTDTVSVLVLCLLSLNSRPRFPHQAL